MASKQQSFAHPDRAIAPARPRRAARARQARTEQRGKAWRRDPRERRS